VLTESLANWRIMSVELPKEIFGLGLARAFGSIARDLRYGVRILGRNRGFTIAAVLSLGLGIGANTATFTVIDSLLLRNLPVKEPGRLARIDLAGLEVAGGPVTAFPYPDYTRLRDNNQVFEGLLATTGWVDQTMTLDGPMSDGPTERIKVNLVSGNYFATLGVDAFIGRSIRPDDDQSGPNRGVAMLSYNFWKRRFGLDPAVTGRTINLSGSSVTVIGVTPAGFSGVFVGDSPDVFLPLHMQPVLGSSLASNGHSVSMLDYQFNWLFLMGRLSPGVTIRQAQSNLSVVYGQASNAKRGKAGDNKEGSGHLIVYQGATGISDLRRTLSKPLGIVMGIVGLILMIACANVANLMLARGTSRRTELSIRLAVGAARSRLVAQLLAESLILVLLGAVLGFLLSHWGSRFLVDILSNQSDPTYLDVNPDSRVLGFTALISALTLVLFGLAPALRSTRLDPSPALNDRAGSAPRSRHLLGKTLVVGQVALSVVLLMAAGLFIRSLQNLRGPENAGFDQAGSYQVSWDRPPDYSDDQLANLFAKAIDQISSIPGVLSASVSTGGLFSETGFYRHISAGGGPQEGERCSVDWVGPNFFGTVGIPIVKGRDFGPEDKAGAPNVAVVNEAFAGHFFGRQDAIGRKVYLDGAREEREVVGTVKDAKKEGLREQASPRLYIPCAQDKWELRNVNFLMVRAIRNAGIPGDIRRAISSVDANVVVDDISRISDLMDATLIPERAIAKLAGFFGILALLLASVGLYGIVAYSVSQRTGELGLRMALGAGPRHIKRLILGETLVMVAIGICIGWPVGVAASTVGSSLLFDLSPADPLTSVAAVLLIAATALLAGYLPARRAAGADPMVSIRHGQ
jgi:putative ABC transport system permease protein